MSMQLISVYVCSVGKVSDLSKCVRAVGHPSINISSECRIFPFIQPDPISLT
jgi:hypothetical protein